MLHFAPMAKIACLVGWLCGLVHAVPMTSGKIKYKLSDDETVIELFISASESTGMTSGINMPAAFTTFEAARSFGQNFIARTGLPLKRTYTFAPGMHSVGPVGIVLNESDAGSEFVGQDASTTFLSSAIGGTNLTWSETTHNGMRAFTTKFPNHTTYFRQLFVANRVATRKSNVSTENDQVTFSRRFTARSEVMEYNHSNSKNPKYAIVYNPGQVEPTYHNQKDVLATIFHCWTATTHRIQDINASNLTLTLLQAPHVDIPRCEHASGKRFYIEDAVEYLSEGEFYRDSAAETITYIPYPHEMVTNFEAYIPQAVTLVTATNTSDISFRGLSFVHGAVDMTGFFEGDCDGQSATNLKSAAIMFTNVSSSVIDRCQCKHVGSFGVSVGGACHNVTVSNSNISDVGAGAMRIGTKLFVSADIAEITDDVIVADNDLSDGGHVYRMGPGNTLLVCISLVLCLPVFIWVRAR